MKYSILKSNDRETLEKTVNNSLALGWQLYGSLQIVQAYDTGFAHRIRPAEFVQAMILVDE
jgi:hypothetical protein